MFLLCPLKNGLGLRAGHVEVLCRRVRRRVLAVREVEDDFSAQAMLFHPRAERRQRGRFPFCAALGAKGFQPVNVAAQLAQPEHVLQIDPEMSPTFREGGHVGRRNDDGRHVVKRANSE